jgi:SPX domain protein involved in polyphosphate accumulation
MPFTDHMQRNRFELKYIIDERCARGVRDFIRSYLVHDRYARPDLAWAYPIYSVYLDSPDLGLFNATLAGHKNRFKLRARYYDDKPDSPVFLEIKRRVNDVILKQRAAVKRGSVHHLLAGAPPAHEELHDENDPEAFAALEQFCHLRHVMNANGRAVVAYTREAWNAADNDDVRVTFDRRISGSWFDPLQPIGEALRADRPWVRPPIEGDGEVVLELKFTGRFPNWMRELVCSFDLYRVTMAKYVNCVLAMGPRGPGLHRHRRVHHIRREALV